MSTGISLRLPERQVAILKGIADETGMTQTQIIMMGIEKMFDSLTPNEKERIAKSIDEQTKPR